MKSHRLAVTLWIIGVLACIVIIAVTRFSTDMSAFLPRSPTPEQQVLVDQLREGVVSRMTLLAVENAPTETLAGISSDLAGRLRARPEFAVVQNGEDAAFAKDGDFLMRNRYLLSPAVSPDRFTAAGLRQALENDLQLLRSDAGMLLKGALPRDPTGEIVTLVSQLASDGRPNISNGVLFSKDGTRAVLLAQTRAAGFDLDAQENGLRLIRADFESAKKDVAAAGEARLAMAGPNVIAVNTRAMMKEDVSRFSMLATVLVAGVLLAAYRSPRALALALVPVVSGALAGVATVSLGFGFVHGITLGFGVTLIGEAVDYAIYLFTQTAPGASPDLTLPRIWPTLRLGVLTSICGFSAMLFSGFTGFAQLGLFTIVGLIVAVAVTRWVLPALLPKGFETAASTRFAPALLGLVRRAVWLRLPLLVLVLGSIAMIVLHRGGLWEDALSSMSPVPMADQQLDQQLRADVGAPDVRYLVVESAPDQDSALAASERLAVRLNALTAAGALAGFDSPARYLPSQAAQRARLAALPDADTLRRNLDQALVGLPFRPDLFLPFLADVAAAKQTRLLNRADFQETNLSLKLDSLLLPRRGGWVAMLPLRGVTDPEHVAKDLHETGGGSVLLDLKGESDRLLNTYRREALLLSLFGSLVIVALLSISLRSIRRVGLVLAPLAAAVILTTAVLTMGANRLSIFNLFGLLLVVAVGSNYCLFFERQTEADQNRERTVASLALANLCTVIGFGVLSFSRITILHGIGQTVAIGAFLSLVFSAILIVPRQMKTDRNDILA